jgi:hypothetical protein
MPPRWRWGKGQRWAGALALSLARTVCSTAELGRRTLARSRPGWQPAQAVLDSDGGAASGVPASIRGTVSDACSFVLVFSRFSSSGYFPARAPCPLACSRESSRLLHVRARHAALRRYQICSSLVRPCDTVDQCMGAAMAPAASGRDRRCGPARARQRQLQPHAGARRYVGITLQEVFHASSLSAVELPADPAFDGAEQALGDSCSLPGQQQSRWTRTAFSTRRSIANVRISASTACRLSLHTHISP